MSSDHDATGWGAWFGWAVGLVGFVGIALGILAWSGCRQYPTVSSRESMNLVKSLYTACNTRDSERLSKVEQKLDMLVREDKVTPAEQAAFRRIISLAQAGDWASAERAAHRFAQDQIGRGHAAAAQENPTEKRR